MSDGIDALGLATAALAVAAASLTGFGLRQRRYEGWRWWVAALWLSTAGAALASLWDGAWGAELARLLLMPWPVLALVGLRRFHPRQSLPGSEGKDWAAWTAAIALHVVATAWGPPVDAAAVLAVTALHLYAAAVLFLGPRGRDFIPVRCLAATMTLAALACSLSLLPAGPQPAALLVQAASAALGTAVLAFVAITLVCERTERQLRDSRRRLRVLANLDSLTQVPNRRHFQELADQALMQDEPGSAVLLVFDIDHFKRINDLFGHVAGDRALALVSSAMFEQLRVHDVPGRQGGDEFVLLLRRTTTRQSMGVAARIVAEVQRRAPGQQLPTLTLSFGMVQIGFGEGIHAAMRRADQAMYEAKRQGRSRAVAAHGDEDEPVFEQSQALGLTPA